jgi:hypothetical protein
MKKLLLFIHVILLAGNVAWSQKSLFDKMQQTDVNTLDQREERIYNLFRANPFVKDITFIKVDVNALNDESINIKVNDQRTTARNKTKEVHDTELGYSWFGQLSDNSGVFFTVMNGQLASKFYMGNVPCLIVPYRDDIHLLVTFHNGVDNGTCGTPHGDSRQTKSEIEPDDDDNPIEGTASIDDNCTMRVLWVVTTQAEAEIPMSLEMAARMLQDESNLAYQQSQITLRMEIARVVRTAYAETTTNVSATAYGSTNFYPSDLINLSTGGGLLSNVPTLRNLYNADVVVMVRSQATNSAQGFYGIAYGVPTGASALNANNAFALISTEYMIGGRFTFAHEIGHIQGARHDNHAASPTYGRGYIFSAAATNNRTIMAVGGSCNPSTGCRVQFFSNPNVLYNGVAVGIVNERDNARRINETATQVLAHRLTSANLILPAETYDNEILARHLATQTISTNNNNVVALAGSRVSFRAGTSVRLLPGFKAMSGSVFRAHTTTCSFVPTARAVVDNVTQSPLEVSDDSGAVSAYPNPVTNTLHITHPRNSKSLSLNDVLGKQILRRSTEGSGHTLLQLKDLPSGVYMLSVDGKKVVRVIKE